MPGPSPVALLRLELEDDDLVAAAVLVDVGRYRRPIDDRRADPGRPGPAKEKDLVEGHIAARFGRQTLDLDSISDLDPVLLAPGRDHRVPGGSTFRLDRLCYGSLKHPRRRGQLFRDRGSLGRGGLSCAIGYRDA